MTDWNVQSVKSKVKQVLEDVLKKIKVPPNLTPKKRKQYIQSYKKGAQAAVDKFLASLQTGGGPPEGGTAPSSEGASQNQAGSRERK